MKKLIFFIMLCLVGLGLAYGIFYFFWRTPPSNLTAVEKKKVMEKLLGRAPILQEKIRSSAWKTYHGTYLSFSYPSSAEIYTTDDKKTNTLLLDEFEFQEKTAPSYFFVTQVIAQQGATTYNDIPGVRVRRLQKDIYQEKSVQIASLPAVLFVKTQDGIQNTAFLLSNGRVFTFSITTNNPRTTEILDRVIHSVSFSQ